MDSFLLHSFTGPSCPHSPPGWGLVPETRIQETLSLAPRCWESVPLLCVSISPSERKHLHYRVLHGGLQLTSSFQLELDLACSSSCSGAGQGGVVTGYFAVNGTCEESWKGNGDEDKNGHCSNKYWEINKSRGFFLLLCFCFWPNAAWKKTCK